MSIYRRDLGVGVNPQPPGNPNPDFTTTYLAQINQ